MLEECSKVLNYIPRNQYLCLSLKLQKKIQTRTSDTIYIHAAAKIPNAAWACRKKEKSMKIDQLITFF